MSAGLQLRGLFTLDERDTLEAFSARWGSAYRVGCDGSRWLASRKDGTGSVLRGLTPDDLAAALHADRTAR